MNLDVKKVEILMAAQCKTINDIANETKLSRPTVRRAINGCEVKPANLGKIAKALDINLKDIIVKK